MAGFFRTEIAYLKGVGPQKSSLLNQELKIFTYGDLIQYYPFRYEDRTKFHTIKELHEGMSQVQVKGTIRHLETIGVGRKKRLTAYFKDPTGEVTLVWFKGISWIAKKLKPGIDYVIFGKPTEYKGKLNFAHPEIEVATPKTEKASYFEPVYHTTEKLKSRFLDSRAINKLLRTLLRQAVNYIHESLSPDLLDQYKLISKKEALVYIHFPSNQALLARAQFRLKFEELFYIQLRLLKLKLTRLEKFRGFVFNDIHLINQFYKDHMPFELTGAQKRVIKEAYRDCKSGHQMNRLLQGDVGSGKTMVAFICILLVVGSGSQAALMAPTEILAEQHYRGLKDYTDLLGLEMAILTGSTKAKDRKILHKRLQSGDLHLLVGTHALLEDTVQFNSLGLAIIDEQHRFGVAQRAKLWGKNRDTVPHILVMTATPIPRTLAMTLYGDLDISIIDELPKGRKPIETRHHYDSNRLKVFGFISEQIKLGRQVYVVYPLIEESEKMDLKHLQDGYESISRAFTGVPVSVVHGRMKSQDKDYEMQRFVKAETKIMVATTVIEVGVNVPNASVMIIENAERFGLAQLHQLRGRVGRGADQSYCILMTSYKITKEARTRIDTMVRTNNGFEIEDVDLKLRGPGDLMGTQQSGVDLIIADLSKDVKILQAARQAAQEILERDPPLELPENQNIKRQVDSQRKSAVNWSRVS
ncbi:MAG: ATP-dependent DNA helicase RecG [Cyclobacteriaceae bacterium]